MWEWDWTSVQTHLCSSSENIPYIFVYLGKMNALVELKIKMRNAAKLCN